MEKVKRLTRIRKLSKIGLFFILPTFLFVLGTPFFVIVGVLSFIIFIISGITFTRIHSILLALCNQCGGSLKGCYYIFKEVSKHKNQYNDILSVVEISIRCPSCGNDKTIQRQYTTYRAERRKDGVYMSAKYYDLIPLIQKDMTKLLGKNQK